MSSESGSEKLQKRLARAGIASRRSAEDMISEGRVTVNNKLASLGQRVSHTDEIRLDGQLIDSSAAPHRTFALYKPRGYVTTAKDEYGRKNVLDAMPSIAGLHPVGRLDRDSEGLLLLTTDGDLTLQLTHPRYGHQKAYRAWTDGQPDQATVTALMQGVELDDGLAKAISASPARDGVFVVLGEGRKRQVRRMLESLGHPVSRLMRYRVGGLWLADMDVGEYKELDRRDLEDILHPEKIPEQVWQRQWERMQRRWG